MRSVSFLQVPNRPAERGGIAILVALILLVFLTIAALGMSRNSFREIVISGTTRQGAMVRNIADSGIEYGIEWIRPASMTPAPSGSAAADFQALATYLLTGQLYGLGYKLDQDLYAPSDATAVPVNDLQIPVGNTTKNGFNLSLTLMGKMPMVLTSQTAGSTGAGNTPAAGSLSRTAPDLWGIRSDAVVNTGGVTFFHSKEAWISTVPRS